MAEKEKRPKTDDDDLEFALEFPITDGPHKGETLFMDGAKLGTTLQQIQSWIVEQLTKLSKCNMNYYLELFVGEEYDVVYEFNDRIISEFLCHDHMIPCHVEAYPKEQILIFIKPPIGNEPYRIKCDPKDTIESVKQQLTKQKIRHGDCNSDYICEMKLSFKDFNDLENDRTLQYYNIQNETFLHLREKYTRRPRQLEIKIQMPNGKRF